MGENTKIEWAMHTFNAWEGCTKVSPGCAHCYAETRNARFGGGTAPNWGNGAPRRRTSVQNWNQPLKWDREAAERLDVERPGMSRVDHPLARPRVFCASLADVFDAEAPAEWRADLFVVIQQTPHLDWLLLTKRPENWWECVDAARAILGARSQAGDDDATAAFIMLDEWLTMSDVIGPPKNIWIGATIENQDVAKQRLWDLSNIPAAVRFVSAEPLLGPLDLYAAAYGGDMKFGQQHSSDILFFDWLICGGESGHGARPMHPDWARSLRDQCKAGEVAFFFKQWGEWAPGCPSDSTTEVRAVSPGVLMGRFGKANTGRKLQGVEHNAFPEVRS